MRYFVLSLIVFLLLALQTPLLHVLGLSAYSIDVALLAAVYFAATSGPLGGFVASALVGLGADAFTPGGILGMNMEIMGIMYLVALGLSGRFQLLRPLPLILVLVVCSVTETLLFFLFSILFDKYFTQYSTVLTGAVPRTMVTALLGPLLFLVFGAVDSRLRGRRQPSPLLR